jgi:CRISPR-associated protein Cas2
MVVNGGNMYVILVYDIRLDDSTGQYSLRNVFKTCKKYLTHIQNSVFEGDLSDAQYLKLKTELNKFLREGKDSCIMFKSRNEKWLEKEFFVKELEDRTTHFL